MIQSGIDPLVLTFLRIDNRGVNIQQGTVVAPVKQTIINNTGNLGTFSGRRGFFFNQRSDDDDFPNGVIGFIFFANRLM
jgi:hypothetical protein